MSIERARACSAPAPNVTKKLCVTVVFFIGLVCMFGGYLLGRMARNEVRRSNDIVSFNLTIAAESLYKKAKRIPPKAVLHSNPEKVASRLSDIFHCVRSECGGISSYNVADFVKISINHEVIKLIKSIYNASQYLDSLR